MTISLGRRKEGKKEGRKERRQRRNVNVFHAEKKLYLTPLQPPSPESTNLDEGPKKISSFLTKETKKKGRKKGRRKKREGEKERRKEGKKGGKKE